MLHTFLTLIEGICNGFQRLDHDKGVFYDASELLCLMTFVSVCPCISKRKLDDLFAMQYAIKFFTPP